MARSSSRRCRPSATCTRASRRPPSRRSGSRSSRWSSGWTTWPRSPTACRTRSRVEKLLGLEMPQRVKDIRVLLAELQRLASHLIWLGTHGMEIGAVSMLFYAVRERELLLNINELIAGFRFFPSYIRIGGLREDLPRGFHDAGERVPGPVPGQDGRVRRPADEERHLPPPHRRRRRTSRWRTPTAGAWWGRLRAPRGSDYDVRKYFPYCGYETYDFRVPTATEGDVYARYRVRIAEMRESIKICRQAIDRITPDRRLGLRRHARRAAAQGQGLLRDGGADSALPDLLAGVHRAGRRRLRADRRPARRARRATSCRTAPTGRGA